jgi:bifunctional non-homologous end joining protein LigD
MFEHACKLRCEGIVSMRKDRGYRAGRSRHWVKVKNRKKPAMSRSVRFPASRKL